MGEKIAKSFCLSQYPFFYDKVMLLKETYLIPSWKTDTPFHEQPDKQMIQDLCTLMSAVVLHKILFHATEPYPLAFVREESLVNFHMVHIPQLLELVLKTELIK